MPSRLLIVEDETELAEFLKRLLARDGYDVETAPSAEEATAKLDEGPFDLVLTDIVLPAMDGIELLEMLRVRFPGQPVVVMTAYPTIDTAVRALRAGAFDYLVKPVISDELKRTVRNALQARSLREANQILRREIEERWDFERIVGQSPAVRAMRTEVARVADARSHILLLGETGTGKELFARAIHFNSSRADRPFVPINCSAVPENLMESELFGFQRGAFTGAVAAKRGLLEEADGGTVFLDEIGEMNHHLQAKLLRVIDDRQVRPLGALQSREVDIRFIAATNQDPARAMAAGAFREDLFYRLNVITLTLPPLRERAEDVPLLACHFLERFTHLLNRRAVSISPEAMRLLERYHWPGNVRELQNVMERAVLLSEGTVIDPVHLPGNLSRERPLRERQPAHEAQSTEALPVLSIEEYTRDVILRHQGERSEQEIASMLGITRKALWEKRKRWNLKRLSS